MQTKFESFIETWVNLIVGFILSYLVGLIIFPMFEMDINASQNFQIVLIFTVVSFLRGYYIRRFFNWRKHENN